MDKHGDLLFWAIAATVCVVTFTVEGPADFFWGTLGGLLVAAVLVCVLWTLIVITEDRAWWRKMPAVCCGLSVVGAMVFLFSLWWR